MIGLAATGGQLSAEPEDLKKLVPGIGSPETGCKKMILRVGLRHVVRLLYRIAIPFYLTACGRSPVFSFGTLPS
jgi:hypothetical protein